MILSIILIFLLLIGDQALKYYVQKTMTLYDEKEIIPNLIKFYYTENKGAGFSILEGKTIFLAILSFVAAIVIGYFLFKTDWKKKKIYSISILLIFAGDVGNLIDRVFASIPNSGRSGVVDMIILEPLNTVWKAIFGSSFAIWNLADSYLVIGVILLCIHLLFFSKEERK